MVKIVNVRSPISSAQNEQFAVALCRVSTEDQFQKGLSIPEQHSRIEKWAETNGVKVLKWEEIHHSAYRGLDEDPRVMDLLKFARETPQVALFLVDEKSRFARRKYLRVTWQEELRRAGVRVVGVSEPDYDRNSIHGIWLEGISETKDEARYIETAYHTTKGMARNAATRDPETGFCYKNGGIAPLGYENQRVTRGKDARGKDNIKLLWAINEERAALVRYIILTLWVDKRMSYREIRDHLNSNAVKYDGNRAPIPNTKGGLWSKTTIREICMRALEGAYTGYYFWNRTGKDLRGTGQKWKSPDDWIIIENAHPAIISREEWERCKAVMKQVVMRRKNKRTNIVRPDNSPYLFSGENAIGEIMFLCTACGSSINSNQAASVNYYACSTYANKGKIGCALGLHIRKADVESKVLKAISNHFTKAHVGKIVKDFNSALDDTQYDQDATEKHLLRSIEGIEKSMANIVKAIEHGSAAVPTLVKRLESLQEEYQALSEEKAKIKKDCPIIPRLSEEIILAKVRMLKNVMDNTSLSNKDRRMIVRYFVRQLRFYPETGEVEIFFWPNPGEEISRLRLINKGKVKKDDDSSFMVFDGAGGRTRTGTL